MKKSVVKIACAVVFVFATVCLPPPALAGAAGAFALGFEAPAAAAIKRFPDVPAGHWASMNITRLSYEGAIAGFPDGAFGPDRSITRAEFVAVVVGALLGKPEAPPTGQHWAVNIMKKAEENNLLKADEFAQDTWNTPINRREMAKIMALAAQYVQKEEPLANTESYTAQITDFDTISISDRPYIAQVYAKGIVTGYPDGSFGGEQQATRAEAATMVVRLLDPLYRLSEISFDPAADVAADGRMKLAKAEQYLMRNLLSLKFYEEDGQYYFAGHVQEAPPGFENWLAVSIVFKQGAVLPIVNYNTIPYAEVTKLPIKGSFKEEIAGMISPDNIDHIRITLAIEALSHNNTTYEEKGYEVYWTLSTGNDNRIDCVDCVANEKQTDKFYDFSRIFQW